MFVTVVLLLAVSAMGQGNKGVDLPPAKIVPFDDSAAASTATIEDMPPEAVPLDVQADHMEYEADGNVLICIGNVVVRNGPDTFRGDYMEYHSETQDLYAKGNVYMDQDGTEWAGEELTYNLKTRKGDFGDFSASMDPFYVTAEDSQKISPTEILLDRPTITTCVGFPPDFYIRARSARILNDVTIKAKGVLFFLGPIPILYLPFWKHTIGKETNWDVVAGYASEMGGFLLTAYNYRLSPDVVAATHFDYRSKRGVGFGQDFTWKDSSTNNNWEGSITGYYIDDKEPYEDDIPTARELELLDEQRYRVRLQHTHSLTPRDVFRLDGSYLSDPDVIEDFFDEEFRLAPQPENRVSVTHRGDRYIAGILVNKRLNDFYDNVDRVPEASLDFQRQQIGQTPFYYQSESDLSALEKVFGTLSTSEDYDVVRADTLHEIFYPTRHFGFLNVIPRAGYRGTYFSDTLKESIVTNVTTAVDTNGFTVITATTNTLVEVVDAEFRNLYELGAESSFKAFKAWEAAWFEGDNGIRHVAEPFLDYSYVPEPNVTPDQLFQFDRVDQLGERHDMTIGMRNKIQTKRNGDIHDLIDLEVFSIYDFDPGAGQEDFSDIVLDAEIRFWEWLWIDFDGQYDHVEGDFRSFNTQVGIVAPDDSFVMVENRIKRDSSNLLIAEADLFPHNRYSLFASARYEFETSTLEEQSYLITRKSDCLGVGLGVKEQSDDDDITVWFQIWLTAFPGSAVSLGR